jgi:hypothetical protein
MKILTLGTGADQPELAKTFPASPAGADESARRAEGGVGPAALRFIVEPEGGIPVTGRLHPTDLQRDRSGGAAAQDPPANGRPGRVWPFRTTFGLLRYLTAGTIRACGPGARRRTAMSQAARA